MNDVFWPLNSLLFIEIDFEVENSTICTSLEDTFG